MRKEYCTHVVPLDEPCAACARAANPYDYNRDSAEQRPVLERKQAAAEDMYEALQHLTILIAAIEAERKRIADEHRRAADEAEKRARNRAHQAAVNREVLEALVALNISEDSGRLLIAALNKGAVPHLKIEY